MTDSTRGLAGGDPGRVAAVAPTYPGRIVVKERVLVKVAEEAAATALLVDRGDVSVDVFESRGGIAVSISTPLPIPRLDDSDAVRASTAVVDRVTAIQAELRDRISHITGRDVLRVNITVTGAIIAQQKRVK